MYVILVYRLANVAICACLGNLTHGFITAMRQSSIKSMYTLCLTLVFFLGHALGLYHEQSRQDRDRYVRVMWPNIQEGDKFETLINNKMINNKKSKWELVVAFPQSISLSTVFDRIGI